MKCVAIEMGNNVWLNNNLKFSQIALCLTEIKKKMFEGKSNTMLKKYKAERKRKRKKNG